MWVLVHPVQTSVFIFDKEIGKFFEFFFPYRVNWTSISFYVGNFIHSFIYHKIEKKNPWYTLGVGW